jgi:L-threonylcarbamoyladenylate synthase
MNKVMPTTIVLRAEDAADVKRAAEMLRAGKLVAFATETVYGLGANALSAEAVARIFEAKKRPSWDPLIVHVAEAAEVERVAVIGPSLRERVDRLARAFWPGPLTMLLPKSDAVPSAVTAGRQLVGVRVPAHPVAQALLRAAKIPVAAPSANLFGRTSPTTAEHVLADLGGRIDAVLDAGSATVGLESTVVDVTGMPMGTPMVLYRPGAVSAEQLEAACGVAVRVFVPSEEDARREPQAMPSPGVGIRHYAPRARVVLVEGAAESVREKLKELREKGCVGVMLPAGWEQVSEVASQPVSGSDSDSAGVTVWEWGDWARPEELAASLYAGLRALDERGVEWIVCPLPQEGAMRDAIRDRLMKAAKSA